MYSSSTYTEQSKQPSNNTGSFCLSFHNIIKNMYSITLKLLNFYEKLRVNICNTSISNHISRKAMPDSVDWSHFNFFNYLSSYHFHTDTGNILKF